MYPDNYLRAKAVRIRTLWRVCRLLGLGLSGVAQAESVPVAVAANFLPAMEVIAEQFERRTGNRLILTAGATGKLAAQIQNGAPFEVFLAADAATPLKLEREGFVVPNTRFIYALGRLVLWSSHEGFVDPEGKILTSGHFSHLSLANPRLTGYGAAAMEVIRALGLETALTPKLVQGENIAQAYQFVATGNAELGFVALSEVYQSGQVRSGSIWFIPEQLYAPIHQEAALLVKGAHRPAARALLDYLKSSEARAAMTERGYRP